MEDSFKALGLIDQLVETVRKKGYKQPSPIQAQAIPQVLAGKDVVGSAQTGTGKTAAFTLPIIQRLLANPKRPGTLRVLIVTPTRELAAQVEESVRTYGAGAGLRSTVVVGGVGMEPQIRALRQGVDILVATPGRLLDLKNQGRVRLDSVEILVLDEMDQMLDMGFIPDVRRIVAAVPRERQTLLFSATAPPEVAHIIQEVTRDPVRIAVALPTSTAARIEQRIIMVQTRELKKHALLAFLQRWERQQLLIFTRTKRGAEGLARFLVKAGHQVGLIHGDRSQGQRTSALAAFKTGKSDILVATSIAARGLDIPAVSHVVNYDLPTTPEEYIHRIGRTARADAAGEAFTFVLPDQFQDLRAIEKALGKQIPREPLPANMPAMPAPDPAPQPAAPHFRQQAPRHPAPQKAAPRHPAALPRTAPTPLPQRVSPPKQVPSDDGLPALHGFDWKVFPPQQRQTQQRPVPPSVQNAPRRRRRGGARNSRPS